MDNKIILQKLTTKGKPIYWEIYTLNLNNKWYIEYVSYQDPKKKKIAKKEINRKNIGKKNETSEFEQAEKELQSKLKLKLQEGYKYLNDNEEKEEFKCMLLNTAKMNEKWISNGCFIQPKIDGLRCFAICKNDNWILLSRRGHEFPFLHHIKNELKRYFEKDYIYDGELYYNKESKFDFQELINIVSVLNKKQSDKEEYVSYKIFDISNTNKPLTERLKVIYSFLDNPLKHITFIESIEVDKWENIKIIHDKFIEKGLEGSVIKKKDSLYENKRSKYCLKIKEEESNEFLVTGFRDGVEKGKVIWICKTEDDKIFDCVPKCTDKQKEDYFNNGNDYIGKYLTVKYQKLTIDNIPRNPIGLCFRED